MIVCRTVADVRHARRDLEGLALVPTMGALHDGHVSLMRVGRELCKNLAVSIFVNPTQFGPNEDFARYPRTLSDDLEKCSDAGAAFVFAPDVDKVIVEPRAVVSIPSLSSLYEGAIRPGHFDGVASIVTALFNIVQPTHSVFGQKDLQQCAVINALVRALHIPVRLHFAATLREPDGLAMSSRNRYLGPDAREQAPMISQVLRASAFELQKEHSLDAITISQSCQRAAEVLRDAEFDVEYFSAVNPSTFEPASGESDFHLIVAARIGGVRLIDNWPVHRKALQISS